MFVASSQTGHENPASIAHADAIRKDDQDIGVDLDLYYWFVAMTASLWRFAPLAVAGEAVNVGPPPIAATALSISASPRFSASGVAAACA